MMLKHADAEMADSAAKYNDLKTRKKRIDEELKNLEGILKEGMSERGLPKGWFGDYEVTVTTVAASTTVDTARLKADGLYEKYSKPKAGCTKLSVEYSKAPKDGLPF